MSKLKYKLGTIWCRNDLRFCYGQQVWIAQNVPAISQIYGFVLVRHLTASGKPGSCVYIPRKYIYNNTYKLGLSIQSSTRWGARGGLVREYTYN